MHLNSPFKAEVTKKDLTLGLENLVKGRVEKSNLSLSY